MLSGSQKPFAETVHKPAIGVGQIDATAEMCRRGEMHERERSARFGDLMPEELCKSNATVISTNATAQTRPQEA